MSKKHARIYEKGGVWYLQDVGSSNGTFMQGKRLTGPTQLSEGAVFGMSRHKFKVTRIGNGAGVSGDDDALFQDDLAPPEPSSAPEPIRDSMRPERSGGPSRPPLPVDHDYPSLGGPPGPAEPSYGEPDPYGSPLQDSLAPGGQMGAGGGDDEIEAKGVGYFFVAVPKAVLFYMKAVPLLALNPLGTIRKSIEEQPQAAMGRMELIAYALPAYIFSALVASWCTFIATLVGGGGFSFMALVPIIPVAISIVTSIIVGLIWHPLTDWLIRLLKGSSDARSRTNYFLNFATATILTQIPSGLAILLSIKPLPFIMVLPPLLSMVATLLMGLLAYRWLVFFNVLRVIQIIVLVLVVLGGLGGVYSVVMAVIGSFSALGSSSGAASDGDAAELATKMKELQDQIAAVQADASLDAEAKAKKMAELSAELQQATPAASAAAAKVEEEKQDEDEKKADGDGDKKDEEKKADGDGEKKKEEEKKADEDKKEEVKEDKKPEPRAVSKTSAKDGPGAYRLPDIPYGQHAKSADFVNRAMKLDPSLLSLVPKARGLYEEYHRVVYEVQKKYAAKSEEDPSLKEVHDRLAEDEIYRRTAKDIADLESRIRGFKR